MLKMASRNKNEFPKVFQNSYDIFENVHDDDQDPSDLGEEDPDEAVGELVSLRELFEAWSIFLDPIFINLI